MDYNPHRPRIVGQEWVPIREEPTAVDLIYAPMGTVEYGNNFTLTQAKALQEARFYSAGIQGGIGLIANVYPLGDEVEAGPVRRVVIPVNNGAVTGTNAQFVIGTTAAQCLLTVDDFAYVDVPFNATASPPDTTFFRAYFGVNQYAQLLNGKRILQVNVLYALTSAIQDVVDTYTPTVNATLSLKMRVSLNNSFTSPELGTLTSDWTNPGVIVNTNFPYSPSTAANAGRSFEIFRLPIGNMAQRSTTPTAFPWTYAELSRFEISASDRLAVQLDTSLDRGNSTVSASNVLNSLHYMALEVFYCDETRVATGTLVSSGLTFATAPRPEVQAVTMYDLNKNANPILQAGDYRTTVTTGLYTSLFANPAYSLPMLPSTGKALRELYSLPTLSSVKVSVPNPFDDSIDGKVFTEETTHLIPQISLHTTGGAGVFTEIHPYGYQAVGKVYGTITAQQVIQDSVLAAANPYPQVRYYARRFGATSVSLTLDSTAITGSSVSITPSDFDALPEIIDGWKEVTLRFSSAPSLGAGTNPTWRWSATGETAGNRWEILGAAAPAISAVPGNLINEVASTQRLGGATYGAPSAGSTVAMSWVPGISPLVSSTTLDAMSDAVLLFAMDMPTVTGFTVVTANQPLTGIGLNCAGGVGCCQPTGLSYNQVTWVPTSLSVPASGFGYYELQRMDTVTTDWQTIMKNTSPSGTSYKDYEARVGLQSSYRIRAVDVLDFAGSWSSTVDITMAAPGVTGGSCISDGHVLIFTSNERQDGSINLAYSEAWMGSSVVEEPFSFPEAGQNVVQMMFDKDFPTIFRPAERGGETFQRTLLVQAAAISPPTAGDFRALRDMAWDDVSYVCVRDEDGNRWFATVIVPDGNIMRDRRLYLATINVIETSDTAFPVVTS
jgi:hypothetical protein